ncbi:MAG TPA: TonB family protein [Gemmatimonadaceae bacterium]|nr:TonB family protein [Gemmatimonadaceae bacterium]
MSSNSPCARVVTLMATGGLPLLLACAPLAAQAPPPDAAGPAPAPAACEPPTASSDSVDVLVHASLRLWSPPRANAVPRQSRPGERGALRLALQTILHGFEAPVPLGLDLDTRFPFTEHRGPGERAPVRGFAIPSLESGLRFTLHADGRVTGAEWRHRSATPALDSALRMHLEREGSSGRLQFLLSGLAEDSVQLVLATDVRPGSSAVVQPLLLARVPRYRATFTRALPGPRPHYPANLLAAGVDGEVRVRYVVDDQGHVEPGSVALASATSNEFAHAVLSTVPGMRHSPMTVAGCATRSWVEAPFVFKVSQ